MTVYVDKARYKYKRMITCHLLADTVDELHEFAASLGMKREWYQPLSTPHYDLSLTRRKMAIEKGATEIDERQVVEIIRKYRGQSYTIVDTAPIDAAIAALT